MIRNCQRLDAIMLAAVVYLVVITGCCLRADSSGIGIRRSLTQAPGQKTCAPGCTDKGNCNIEDGRCECPIGVSGPTCNVQDLRACQASPADLPFWGTFMPKNCECYRQSSKFFNCTPNNQRECQIAIYQTKLTGSRCYEYKGKSAEEQWSDLPEAGDSNVNWFTLEADLTFRQVDEAAGRKTHNLWGYDKCKPLRLSECPDSCSRRGSCIKDCEPSQSKPAVCECHKGYRGHNCAQVHTELCPNSCNQRGTCQRGFCHCQPPWFGLDCSRSKGFPPRPSNVPTRTRPVIYVYELPHSVSSPVELDDNLDDHVSIYSSYTHFLDIVLRDWAVRTEDPWEANLFYIPSFTYSYSSNVADPVPHLRRVVQYIQTTYPFFDRNQGKDHFLWLTGDHGACEAPKDLANIIKLVHFGYHANQRIQGASKMGRSPKDPVHGCFNPARDIVAAPYNDLGYDEARVIFDQIAKDQGNAPDRINLFFFAGGVREKSNVYSGGVRQAIHTMLKEYRNSTANSSDIIFIDGGTSKYQELYRTTKFCLAPHGSGFGIRLSIAMVHGCIPVVIQDHVFQPFEDTLPYEDFSVRVAKKDVPDLIHILRSIGQEEQQQMRLRMAQYYQAFIWEPHHGGMAYNYTITSLYKRLHAMWGELYKK